MTGEQARAWLYGSAMHSDVPLSSSGSAIAAVYLNLMGHGVGWPSPEGGAGRLAGALISYLDELGGTVRTGAKVTRFAAERGHVVGVELADGERLLAPVVIADVMPGALAALAGEALPARYARALRRYRPGPATLKVDWALDGEIPWTSPRGPRGRHRARPWLGARGPSATAAIAGRLPERPFMLLGQQSIADPSRAPAGRHTAWAYTHGPRSVDWESERDRHVQRMEEEVERFAPGFRDRILARHVLAPGDLERRNANLVDADVGGGSNALDQVIFRPVPSLAPYRTPVRGLYLGSAATFPGGGVHGVPGHAAARLALAEARVSRLARAVRPGDRPGRSR